MIGAIGPRVPAHQVTTRNLGAAYPFIAEAGLGQRGVVIGDDLLGGSFVFDPFELYAQGMLSNPNMVVFGQIGRGKSAFVKTFLWRQAVFGRRAWVVDPKGEYGDLAAAWGVRPVALRPGGAIRLNPLDPGPEQEGGVIDGEGSTARRQMELLASLASACLGRNLLPRERAALGVALATAAERAAVPTVPSVVEALLAPTAVSAASLRTDLRDLLEDGRDVALELRRLVHGDLAGMFDGPTTPGLDLSAPLVVLDLSALYTSAALGILMACATAWLQAALARSSAARGGSAQANRQVFLVVDESWAILSNLGVARWLQSSWKLSRSFGVSNVAVVHRVTDLHSVGASDSEQVALAKGLLADSETRVIYAQSPGELAVASDLLSLSSTEASLLPQLRRGVALWKVGQGSFLVQHRLSSQERILVDTDGAMTAG
jgi:type IV secretory pathway VirB4 component